MPWPVTTGGRMRDARLLPLAVREWQTDAVFVADPDAVERDRLHLPRLDGLTSHVFVNESTDSPRPTRYSRGACAIIEKLRAAGKIDAIHVEGSYLCGLLDSSLLRRAVVVEHNIESALLEQRLTISMGNVTNADVQATQEQEERVWRSASRVVALTAEDETKMRARVPEMEPSVVMNGWDHVDLPHLTVADPPGTLQAPQLLFLANHRYLPNHDALRWLVTEVFPMIQRKVPQASLVIAGANLDRARQQELRDIPGVEVAGFVPDVTRALDRADIVLCPLRVGGGIKVKMTEALRRRCLIVSTTVGAQGIRGADRDAIGVADTACGFADEVVLLCDPVERVARRRRLAGAASDPPRWTQAYEQLAGLWREGAGLAGCHR